LVQTQEQNDNYLIAPCSGRARPAPETPAGSPHRKGGCWSNSDGDAGDTWIHTDGTALRHLWSSGQHFDLQERTTLGDRWYISKCRDVVHQSNCY